MVKRFIHRHFHNKKINKWIVILIALLFGFSAFFATSFILHYRHKNLVINSKAKIPPKNYLSDTQVKHTSIAQCHTISDGSQKMVCWTDLINYTIASQGVKASFGEFTDLYNTEPYFAQNCHGFTHQIGQAAYKKYANHEDFGVAQQVAYCSYGFFHGFIEAMFQDQGTLDKARDFCDYIDKQLEGQTAALTPCLHGIGHGVTDGSDTSAWGNVFALINPGLDLCGKVGKDDYEKMICATGVFNSLEGMYLDSKYKLNLDKKDPYWICRQQKTQYFERGCYEDLKDVVMTISNNDLPTAAKFVEAIKEDDFANWAMDNVTTYAAYTILRQPDFTYAIKDCQKLQTRLHNSCIAGLGAGFMTAGTPDLEYVKALKLCKSDLLDNGEKTACFQRVLHASYLRYSPDKHQQVCVLAGSDAKLSNDCSVK